MRNVLLCIALAGCGATIRSSVAPNANLGQYHTFAFAPPANQPQSLMDQTIRSALRRDLTNKGMVEAQSGQRADFIVDYHVTTQQKLETYPVGWGYYGYAGLQAQEYTQGTITVVFVDPQTRQVFWRGTATDVVNHPESPNLNKLDKVVGQVVQRYPVVAVTPRSRM